MWKLAAAVAACVASSDSDCNEVVFEHVDSDLSVRTMVVEDASNRRMLVLTPSDDKSEPCTLQWWLDHNPQGAVQCRGNQADCDPAHCNPDPEVELGYVRTMLASALYRPGSQSKLRPSWQGRKAKRVLVIGLGSSTMALWFRRNMPEVPLDVAELVPSVVAAAPCFGLDPADKSLQLHTGDGREFLQRQPDGAYDAILVDAFDSNASLPECFRSREFFAMAHKKLAPGGAMSFNLLLNKGSKRILKSMASSFDLRRVWVGDAPGAQMVQDVITAFSNQSSPHAAESYTVPQDAARWFQDARFRALSASSHFKMPDVQDFEDGENCKYSK